jgi:hypothetical protein
MLHECGHDNAWMDARGVKVARAMSTLNLISQVDIRRLGLAIGHGRVIVALLEVVVVGIIDAADVVR